MICISHSEDQENKLTNTWGLMRAEGPATGERQASGVAPTWSERKM